MPRFVILFFVIFVTFSTSFGFAEDAREIMRNLIDRDDGTTELTRIRLSTCRYKKEGKRVVCVETPRTKILEGVRKDWGPRGKDHKTITMVLDPPGERGIGFLQYDYEKWGKETDQWIYLSAMGKVKRIISGNENEPKTGSFFGSEISYEDMEAHHLEDYTYTILASETYQKRPCWVIESIPIPEHARRSNYSKIVDWVDKERFLVLKSILYNRQGKKVKRVTARKPELINGIWFVRYVLISNLITRRMTVMIFEAVALNIPIEDEFLTQRTLTDGAFRESTLKRLRLYLK